MTKPTLGESLKTIANAIGGEVDKHGGVKGLAVEVFDETKKVTVKAADTIGKAANDAGKYFNDKSADFKAKYDEALKKAESETAEKTEKEETDAAIADIEKQAKLDEEEEALRARLAEIKREREGK